MFSEFYDKMQIDVEFSKMYNYVVLLLTQHGFRCVRK